MNCVILQPSYIPWRGYFHQIARADVFIFLDDVQYDKHGWRNRNRIKTANGPQWLTIPIHSRGVITNHTLIKDIPISWNTDWTARHTRSIFFAYKQAPFFDQVYPFLEALYTTRPALLADFTMDATIRIAQHMGFRRTRFLRSSTLNAPGNKTERLINLIRAVGADHYISGPSAQAYIEPGLFAQQQITLEYMAYEYPEYPQLHPPFDPHVSIVDLLFMTGPNAMDFFLNPQERLIAEQE